MKKKIFGLFLVVCCLIITGCARTVTYSSFKEKIENKESFVVLVIQNGCSHCENFKPVFDEFANDNDISYVKLNLTNLTSTDSQELNSNYTISGTPTILFFKNGKVQEEYTISGEVPKKNLKTVFKKAGYIK